MGIIAYADSIEDVEAIPTGLFIDRLTGIGGIPRGCITELFGDEGIGKTSLCLQIVAAAQRSGLRCLWSDVEWAYDARYAASLGVDNSKLGILRDRYAEATLEKLEEAIDSGNWDLVILDSVGAIQPRVDAEKELGGKTVGSQASLMAKFCRKVIAPVALNNVALLVINHSFIDIMSGRLMTSGGKKLAYHKALSIRLKLKQNAVLKQGERKVGKVVIGEVKKNKHAATEGLEVEGQLIFGTGFSVAADLLSDAIEKGVITKKGNTYYLLQERLGVGLSSVRKAIEVDSSLQTRIKDAMSEV